MTITTIVSIRILAVAISCSHYHLEKCFIGETLIRRTPAKEFPAPPLRSKAYKKTYERSRAQNYRKSSRRVGSGVFTAVILWKKQKNAVVVVGPLKSCLTMGAAKQK